MAHMPIVLVHGGGFAASCWDLVVDRLKTPAIAVDLPGRGNHPFPLAEVTLDLAADSVVADIDAAGYDEVILVGHSLAGCTMPGVIERLGDRLRHAVFVACMVPPHGASAFDMLDPAIQDMAREAKPDSEATMPAEIARVVFANDLDEAQFEWMLARMVPDAPQLSMQPVDLTPLEAPFPRTWIRPTQDAILLPARQLDFARNAGDCQLIDIDAGHMCMIGRPTELAGLLDAIVDVGRNR